MGIYDRLDKSFNIFNREKAGAKKATEVKIHDLDDPRLAELIPDDLLANLKEELEILDEIVEPLDMEEVCAKQNPKQMFCVELNSFETLNTKPSTLN